VIQSAREKDLPDFTEKDGIVWYTPYPDEPPWLYVPKRSARTQLL